ncbi:MULTISPECIES: hypothetical protein [unclassified Shewanella]|uniref:hypothetical protein n=1 Tax=unclassified Shewanella TaxID=196818 RepID=UPI001BC306A2|nr:MULTISPECIES: hypothetical protein [unclassified Shewanella]GIU09976.1 membrane anchored protein in chemotaxis locus [Shewanella sp. MBTL60-112-B1]GIU37299.1 membrane anchored protein in chemotaxis locus [Shewanella sp. MBTL60-112-B2]
MAKALLKQSSILQRGEINTLSLLLMFLLSIASFTFGSLYFEAKHKNKLLSSEVQKLKNSQVLLMVPDEQAEVMANWMAENPDFVSSFVDKAKQGESTVLPIGPGAQQSSSQSVSSKSSGLADDEQQKQSVTQQKPVKPVSEKEQEQEKSSNGVIAKTEQKHTAAILSELDRDAVLTVTDEERSNAAKMKDSAFNSTRVVKQAVMLNESPDGVKLISLPHGGIRVTTRELEK